MKVKIPVRLAKVEHLKMGLDRALADVLSASVELAESKRRLSEVARALDFECDTRKIPQPWRKGRSFVLQVNRDGRVSVSGLDLSFSLSPNAEAVDSAR